MLVPGRDGGRDVHAPPGPGEKDLAAPPARSATLGAAGPRRPRGRTPPHGAGRPCVKAGLDQVEGWKARWAWDGRCWFMRQRWPWERPLPGRWGGCSGLPRRPQPPARRSAGCSSTTGPWSGWPGVWPAPGGFRRRTSNGVSKVSGWPSPPQGGLGAVHIAGWGWIPITGALLPKGDGPAGRGGGLRKRPGFGGGGSNPPGGSGRPRRA